jgi:hypothetical protein
MREFSWRRGRQEQPGRLRRRPVAAIAGVAAGLLGASLLATSVANAGVRSAAAPRTAAAVPWKSVGPGWVLAEYSTGTQANPAATTLELVSPAGFKYALRTWAKSAALGVAAWSPSKTEVLLAGWSKNAQPFFDRLNLQTGAISPVNMGNVWIASYTLPTGLQILAEKPTNTRTTWTDTLERFTKTGQLAKALLTEKSNSQIELDPVYAPDGASIALVVPGGVAVISNAGGPVEKLPVPGWTKAGGCRVARWWNSSTILASCGARLWLVPANGAKPRALTPVRANIYERDFGAWQLPSGLYLNTTGPACGTEKVNKQSANGSITTLNIPGLHDANVLTASGPRLLVYSFSCDPTNQPGYTVAWYNPATKAEQVLFAKGAFGILPFPSIANADTGI